MADANDFEPLKEWLTHAINIEYFGNGLTKELIDRLEALYGEIEELLSSVSSVSTKKIYTELLEEIEIAIADYESNIRSTLDKNIDEIAESESNWLKKFAAALGLSYVIPRTIKSQVRFTPFATNMTYEDVASNSAANIRKNIDASLRTAYMIKEPMSNIIERLNVRKEKNINALTKEAKTFNTAMFRATDLNIFRANSQRLRYIATLDSHTCLVCGEAHGKIFKASEAPLLPMHIGCRCSLIPVGSEMDKEFEYSEIDLSFSDYLSSLDDDELYDVLGKSRYLLYKQGVPVSQFVDSGRILTLDELKDIGISLPESTDIEE